MENVDGEVPGDAESSLGESSLIPANVILQLHTVLIYMSYVIRIVLTPKILMQSTHNVDHHYRKLLNTMRTKHQNQSHMIHQSLLPPESFSRPVYHPSSIKSLSELFQYSTFFAAEDLRSRSPSRCSMA